MENVRIYYEVLVNGKRIEHGSKQPVLATIAEDKLKELKRHKEATFAVKYPLPAQLVIKTEIQPLKSIRK